jgi:anaerobic selenocysteine-containing dehydrogenase
MAEGTQGSPIEIGHSTCPHDCPSACALDVEVLSPTRIGRVRGAKGHSYTAGVVCEKVARYAERVHHKDRLLHPLRRKGPKGSGQFERISWDDALDITAAALLAAERRDGPGSVWPYHYAGTMGLVMRDGLNRLRHVKRYAQQYSSICTTLAWTGYIAGTGRLTGSDPREMAKSDAVVIWGTNPVNTQVNVMTHAIKARKERGAKIVAIDIYRNGTIDQADIGLVLRPGSDGALACAVMHVLFKEGYANRAYLERYTDCPGELEAHLATKTPDWGSAITGLGVSEIEDFARLVGRTPRSFLRIGYGFARQRNGAHNVHAALSIPAVTGAWLHEGGGAFISNSGIYGWDKTLIEGLDQFDPAARIFDQSRIGPVLTGDPVDLAGGPPVGALFIQNTNPVEIAPEQALVKQGFAREDLFVCVHEQFMTATARMADIVLPATMFLEHDDIYQGGGQQHIQLGLKLIDPPGECRDNHNVVAALAKRVGASHPGFEMTPRELIDATLRASKRGTLAELEEKRWLDCQPPFEESHFTNGFAWPDGKFRFKPDWANVPSARRYDYGNAGTIPRLPDHWAVNEAADARHPFKLATSPSRGFLNSTFNETPTSRSRQGKPRAKMHPADVAALGLADGDPIAMGNERGEIALWVEAFEGVQRGVVIVEGVQPNTAFPGGAGINTLTSAYSPAPYGGAAFHDNHVWIKPRDVSREAE